MGIELLRVAWHGFWIQCRQRNLAHQRLQVGVDATQAGIEPRFKDRRVIAGSHFGGGDFFATTHGQAICDQHRHDQHRSAEQNEEIAAVSTAERWLVTHWRILPKRPRRAHRHGGVNQAPKRTWRRA